MTGKHTITSRRADRMIENVVGVMGMPMGLALNFLINGRDRIVPLVVEEPSIVAALSSAAKTARAAGGFTTEATDPILAGQVEVVDVADVDAARTAVVDRKDEIIALANSLQPKMVARGGGAVDIEVLVHQSPRGAAPMLGVHLLVNTCDAMGANLVNTMCEGVAPLVESMTGGRVFLRILSNLSDRAVVRASVAIAPELLAGKGFSGEEVRDGIVQASDLALVDPYRATTHNKGVMNGVDALALATGNDWRALEAAAHAFAARFGRYSSMTTWDVSHDGSLTGSIELPMKVGTVGGPLQSNPTVALAHRVLGVESAVDLAQVMGAVGLGQNFSALRALVTDGIQQGHMSLHARTVAAAAGAPTDLFDAVVDGLIDDGEIKVWKAKALIAELRADASRAAPALGQRLTGSSSGHVMPAAAPLGADAGDGYATGYGKIILLGEHAVVHGRHAVAAPVPFAVRARAEKADDGVGLVIPRWGIEQRLQPEAPRRGIYVQTLEHIIRRVDLVGRPMRLHIQPNIPRAVGLGGSAAMAVAMIRAIDELYRLDLPDERINQLAFECEKAAHGTPSGIDNTLATYGRALLFRRGDPPLMQTLDIEPALPMVIGLTGIESLTATTVARVREGRQRQTQLYEKIFDEIDGLALQGAKAVTAQDLVQLGELMDINQVQLQALQVSSPELEELVRIARHAGASGAKLTGGGGGGAMIAVCPEGTAAVSGALRESGYQAIEVNVGNSI
jgi:hydroxymethylglutaryl-CoA reductase